MIEPTKIEQFRQQALDVLETLAYKLQPLGKNSNHPILKSSLKLYLREDSLYDEDSEPLIIRELCESKYVNSLLAQYAITEKEELEDYVEKNLGRETADRLLAYMINYDMTSSAH